MDARKINPKGAQFVRADIRNLKGIVADAAVDEILAWDILEHLQRADQLAVLGECYRMLQHGGRLEVKMPEIGLLLQWSQGKPHRDVSFRWYGQHDIDPNWMYPQNVHQYVWPADEFAKELKRQGFRLLEMKATEETNMVYIAVKE